MTFVPLSCEKMCLQSNKGHIELAVRPTVNYEGLNGVPLKSLISKILAQRIANQ